MEFLALTATTATTIAEAIQGVELGTVLNQLVACVPTILGFSVSVVGLRKAYSFVMSAIRQA